MKKLIFILFAFFSLISCRNEEEPPTIEQQYGFSIDRDNNFSTLPIGYTNQFKLNLVTNYDFYNSGFATTFIFHTNQFGNGIMKLNGVVLAPNTTYNLINKNNIFEYTGNVVGEHEIKFHFLNPKQSQQTTFKFNYQ